MGKTKLTFMPLTVEDYIDLVSRGAHEDEISLMTKMVTNKEHKEAYEIIYNLGQKDLNLLQIVDENLDHRILPLTVKCEKCNYENEVELDGGRALLLPFRRSKQFDESSIHFGNENED